MAFADIACGSGSFLIEVYSLLLKYHERYYMEHPDRAKKGDMEQREGRKVLSLKKRKEILVNNIYGVDIDYQATEVTQLSLYLKLLEDATRNLAHQFVLFKEKMLPDLKNNIVCQNSLIGRDITEGDLFPDIDESPNGSRWDKLKPMNFEDVFPDVMKRGGFDAIVGNPPYVRIQGFDKAQVGYFTKNYRAAYKNYDIYAVFAEKGFDLLDPQGKLGFILPNKFLRTDYGEGLRKLLSEKRAVDKILDFGVSQVFNVTTYTCLLFLSKTERRIVQYTESLANPKAIESAKWREIGPETLTLKPWTFSNPLEDAIENKLSQRSVRLLDLPADMSRGSSSGDDEVFVIDMKSLKVERGITRIPVFATDFKRFEYHLNKDWRIIFPYEELDGKFELISEKQLSEKFPRAYKYLRENQVKLKQRKQYSKWYSFSAPRNLELHEKAQFLVPLLAERGTFALIPSEARGNLCPMASGGFTITLSENNTLDVNYVLGLLNSRLLFWKLRRLSNVFRGGWITCTKQYFGELPVKEIDFSDAADKARHNQIVQLVERMLAAKQDLSTAKTQSETGRLERDCDALDRQIDQAVYQLYGLTEEEIKVVEGK